MVDLDEIKKRWGDAKKGSQYYADVHALMDEVDRLKKALRIKDSILSKFEHKFNITEQGLPKWEKNYGQ